MSWEVVKSISEFSAAALIVIAHVRIFFLWRDHQELERRLNEVESREWTVDKRLWYLEEKLESTIETIEILSDPGTVADIRDGENELLTYEEFIAKVEAHKPEEWRLGQTYFNDLFTTRPELANQIRSGPIDPFNDDRRIESFKTWLKEVW